MNPDGAKSDRETGGHRAREELLDATPVTERQLMLAGISTAVLIGGDGPPIVLLHGPGEFAFTWLRVVPELVKTNRLIIPDLPGHPARRGTTRRRPCALLAGRTYRADLPVAGLPGWPPARRRHRGAIRHRSQRRAAWACLGGHVRSVPAPTIAALHAHADQLPSKANGRQP